MIFKRKNVTYDFILCIVVGLIFFFFLSTSNLKLFGNDKEILKIEDYFNSIRTLKSDFVQKSDSNFISTGTFFLKKPGKFRFSYDPPIELEVVSHIQAVLIFDPKNNKTGPLTYPISGSPFKYLLKDKLELSTKSFTKISTEEDMLFVKLNMGTGEKNNLTLKFKKNPIKLAGWELENNFGEVTKVFLDNLNTIPKVSFGPLNCPQHIPAQKLHLIDILLKPPPAL